MKYYFNHCASIFFLISFSIYIYQNPPRPTHRFSVITKRNGEEKFSFNVQQVLDYVDTVNSKGYISRRYEGSTCKFYNKRHQLGVSKPIGSTVLLENLENECDFRKSLHYAVDLKYDAILFYNHSHSPELKKFETTFSRIFVGTISNEDATRLFNYTFPETVRFHIVGNNNLIQPAFPTSGPFLFIFRTRPWILTLQVFLYGLFIYLIWRRLFVKKRDITKFNSYWKRLLIYGMKDLELFVGRKVQLGHFTEIEVLGRGAYGIVNKVSFFKTGEYFAMKTMHKKYRLSLLEAEIMATATLQSYEGIVKLMYGFTSLRHVHLVMEIMNGSLSDFMEGLTIQHARQYTVELAVAIETLHLRLGVAHLDIKPSNIMLNSKFHIKLGDFGCAREIRAVRKHQGSIVKETSQIGTPNFMAPESTTRNEYTLNSDWWGYGIIVTLMHHRLNGNFDVPTMNIIQACRSENPFRYPFVNEEGNSCCILDLESFFDIPIPIDQEVNMREKFPFQFDNGSAQPNPAHSNQNEVPQLSDGIKPYAKSVYEDFYFQRPNIRLN